jgi:hypothetical protein
MDILLLLVNIPLLIISPALKLAAEAFAGEGTTMIIKLAMAIINSGPRTNLKSLFI